MEISKIITGPLAVNTWFIPGTEGRLMIVDPGGDSAGLIARVQKLGLPLEAVLLTHGHFDHMGALNDLAEAFPQAAIGIHPDDRRWLGSGSLALHRSFFTALGAGDLVKGYTRELPEASLFLEEGVNVGSWRVIHTPGHSPGSIVLYNADLAVLVAGDTLFSGGVGRTDGPGGDEAAMGRSLERLLALPPETSVLCGHGPSTTIDRERGNLLY